MSIRTGTFIVMLALAPAWGCSQRYLLRMSHPEQSSAVALYEGGREETDDDDRTTVLNEPERIMKVARFFEARADHWRPLADNSPRPPRCTIKFIKDDQETDRFWVDRERLLLQTPDGKYMVCDLSARDRAELFGAFRSSTNSRSTE